MSAVHKQIADLFLAGKIDEAEELQKRELQPICTAEVERYFFTVWQLQYEICISVPEAPNWLQVDMRPLAQKWFDIGYSAAKNGVGCHFGLTHAITTPTKG